MTPNRARLFFWLVVLTLVSAPFVADAMYKNEVCISAMMVDESGTTRYPEVCR